MSQYYADTFNLFVALAPVVRLDKTSNKLFKFASQFTAPLMTAIEGLHLYNLMPRNAGS